MCLNTVELNLRWSRHAKAYLGTGYKRINDLSLYNKIGRWTRAGGNQYSKSEKGVHNELVRVDYTNLQMSPDWKEYHPGFHIFLNEDDAKNYMHCYGKLYQVQFKNVLSFGKNEVNYQPNNYDRNFGPCVVTEYMRIVKEIK